MKPFFISLAVLLLAIQSVSLSASPLQDGMNAFAAKEYEKAERILKPIEKQQPSAAYLLQQIRTLNKSSVQNSSKKAFLTRLNKGDNTMFEKLGMVARASGKVSGFSGAIGLNNLILNANQNDPGSVYQLALFYQEGIGVPRNFNIAAKYFQTAAANGNSSAMNTLGVYYRYGIGVKKNPDKAQKYLKEAIQKNNVNALFNLAEMADEGDGIPRDALMAYLLSDLAVAKFDKQEKQKIARAAYLQKKNRTDLSVLQQAYLNKFVPFWLSGILSKEYLNGRTYPKMLPPAPANGKMIQAMPFMVPVNKNPEANKYKTILPFLPDWVPFPSQSETNPVLSGKLFPAPSVTGAEFISALYYRPADPRQFQGTLTAQETAMPFMSGDMLSVYVYTRLHDTKATLKGASKAISNTDYIIEVESEPGVLEADYDVDFISLSPETAKEEAWIVFNLKAGNPGKAIVRFIPRRNEESEKTFSYSFLAVVSAPVKPK